MVWWPFPFNTHGTGQLWEQKSRGAFKRSLQGCWSFHKGKA